MNIVDKSDLERLEKKIDKLLDIFGVGKNPRRTARQLDAEAQKSVLDFMERRKHKKGHGRAKD